MKRNWTETIYKDEYVHCSRIASSAKGVEEYMILTTRDIFVVQACGLNWMPQLIWQSKIRNIEAVKLDKRRIMIISNPQLIRKSMTRMKEDTKTLYSVYSSAFDSEDDAKAMFTHLEDERKETIPFKGYHIKFDM